MSQKKQLWILVGGNGAGKSTFYNARLRKNGIPFINADVIAKEVFPDDPESHSYDAAMLADQRRERLLIEGRSFCFETVFSHPSKIDFIAKAKGYGFEINMVFVHLVEDQLNQARVHQRVKKGGHSVPAQKVKDRIPRVLANVKSAIPLCDQVLVLDNSSSNNPFEVVAIIKQRNRKILKPTDWVNELLG
jgi:predicted ABC-type ATPase